MLFLLRHVTAKHDDEVVADRELGDRLTLERLDLGGQLADALVAVAKLTEGVAAPRVDLA